MVTIVVRRHASAERAGLVRVQALDAGALESRENVRVQIRGGLDVDGPCGSLEDLPDEPFVGAARGEGVAPWLARAGGPRGSCGGRVARHRVAIVGPPAAVPAEDR